MCCLFFRGSKDRQELWRAPHLQNLHLEVCQCLHTHCLFGLFQGQVKQWLLHVGFLCIYMFSSSFYRSLVGYILSFVTFCPNAVHNQQYVCPVYCWEWQWSYCTLPTFFISHMWWFCLVHRLVGRPGNYLYVVGSYRMEEVIQTKSVLLKGLD